jgi:acetyl esterase/lipase
VLPAAPYSCCGCCTDFAGSGSSGGDIVSLGYYESDDLAAVTRWLRQRRHGRIGLWGHSMGAVAALLHAKRDPLIACLVLDAPFADLHGTIGVATALLTEGHQLCSVEPDGAGDALPCNGCRCGCGQLCRAVGGALVRRLVLRAAGFDVKHVRPVDSAASCCMPALFAHDGGGDRLVLARQAQALHTAYAGDKHVFRLDRTGAEHAGPVRPASSTRVNTLI